MRIENNDITLVANFVIGINEKTCIESQSSRYQKLQEVLEDGFSIHAKLPGMNELSLFLIIEYISGDSAEGISQSPYLLIQQFRENSIWHLLLTV